MSNQRPADELRSFRDRIVRLEEQKKEIGDDIADVYAEAKARGYDKKALRLTVKRSMETAKAKRDRAETEAIAELYMGTLGMLDGTPLGDAARRRAAQPDDADDDEGEAQSSGAGAETEDQPQPDTLGPEEISAARQRGRDDAHAGKRILDNPFTAGDPRRAAWDEGHCEASGSDGMDIPPGWRRPDRKKKPDGE